MSTTSTQNASSSNSLFKQGHDRSALDHHCMTCRVEAGGHSARDPQSLKLFCRSAGCECLLIAHGARARCTCGNRRHRVRSCWCRWQLCLPPVQCKGLHPFCRSALPRRCCLRLLLGRHGGGRAGPCLPAKLTANITNNESGCVSVQMCN
jgi:hypothetical protein